MGGEGVKGGGSKVGEKGGGRNQRSQHPSGVCQFGLLCVSVRLDAELCVGWLCGGGKGQQAFASFAFLLLALRYVTVCVRCVRCTASVTQAFLSDTITETLGELIPLYATPL